ncbi:MAG: hypothetical protein JWQ18_800 [Conexibacter sp.]|nr:hypothetical protein [Conexibacter sp.]
MPSVALAVALVLVFGAVAWAASPPRKSARYTGESSQHRKVAARVTSDGKTLQLRVMQVFRCNRGKDKISESKFLHQAPTIRADGTFDYHKVYPDEAGVPGFDEVHTDDQTVTGSFVDGGRRVHGKITAVTTGRSGLTCRSSVTFTARAR